MYRKVAILLLLMLSTLPASATSYFIAPAGAGGNDANNGTSVGTPWLSPNHALNCGDTITAASGTYSNVNFYTGQWGTVTCAGGNNVAWLICGTFDACTISASNNNQAMWIDKSYWGVQGWDITATGTNATCIFIRAQASNIHHFVIANNVLHTCNGGVSFSNNGATASDDYGVVIGNAVYNAALGSAVCASGISVYQPQASDTQPGTHFYIAGNFSWDNLNPNPCNGGAPTDGEGIILDTLDGGQGFGTAYAQQITVENNLVFLNGGRGVEVAGHGNTAANIYILYNTAYGDNKDPNQSQFFCADISMGGQVGTVNTQAYFNIAQANTNTGCGGLSAVYAWTVDNGNGTDHVYNDWIVGVGGSDTLVFNSTGFSYGPNNTIGTTPSFVSVADPGAPSCGSFADVPHCMATIIANFTPTVAAARSYGRQPVSTTPVYDPLYPAWLATVTNLPAGLVTPGTLTGTGVGSGVTISSGSTVH